jgi:hypothetical protein
MIPQLESGWLGSDGRLVSEIGMDNGKSGQRQGKVIKDKGRKALNENSLGVLMVRQKSCTGVRV